MYGAAHYVIIDDVRMLPFKLPDIYRRLTSPA
jgi:nitric oxide reductase activation protein